MSADNWSQCPRCYIANRAKAEELDKIAAESYGKVPAQRFDQLRNEAFSFRKSITSDSNFTSSLREDYELGILKGKFEIDYYASCAVCGFEFQYKHKEEVK